MLFSLIPDVDTIFFFLFSFVFAANIFLAGFFSVFCSVFRVFLRFFRAFLGCFTEFLLEKNLFTDSLVNLLSN